MTGPAPAPATGSVIKLIPMDIGSGRTIQIPVRSDVVDYFNITGAAAGTAALTPTLRRRKAYTRQRYASPVATAPQAGDVNVEAATWFAISTAGLNINVGKLIKIPTEILTAKNNIRYVSLRIDARATNVAIAVWINSRFSSKKPGYFILPAGGRFPTNIASVADVNPGNAPEPAPAP